MGYYVDKKVKDFNGELMNEITMNGKTYHWNSVNKDYQDSQFNLLTKVELETFIKGEQKSPSFKKNSYYIYSGTPEIIYGDLKYPIFATQLMRVARRYATNTGASSLKTNKQGGEPKIMKFIVTPNTKILDLRKSSERRKFDTFFRNHSLSGMYVETKTGLPDWTEGIGLAEWIDKYNMNYDIVLLDEGSMFIDAKLIRSDGISLMILNNSVKLDKVEYLK